jgi:uncharacterized protein (UPF0276 family)
VTPANHIVSAWTHGPIPASAGIGLRAAHHAAVIDRRPPVGWFEAHSENFFADGGSQPEILARVRENYPLSLHGVGLSLGSADELDRGHLAKLKRLVDRFQPALVSEHISWGSIDGVHFNDLLPLPFTDEALMHVARRVRQVQDVLGRAILLENVSSYLEFTCSEMGEWEFVSELARESGSGILLDVNNIYVASRNHGFDAAAYLNRIPRSAVGEIHLAGHSRRSFGGREILIDTHNSQVCAEVWGLYGLALQRFGPVPTLIEWDADLPALEVLVAEAQLADRRREVAHARAA